jgi:hypothetical protein
MFQFIFTKLIKKEKMENNKMRLKSIKGLLSRDEMKKILA